LIESDAAEKPPAPPPPLGGRRAPIVRAVAGLLDGEISPNERIVQQLRGSRVVSFCSRKTQPTHDEPAAVHAAQHAASSATIKPSGLSVVRLPPSCCTPWWIVEPCRHDVAGGGGPAAADALYIR
jgi:hypothetical protein